MSILQKKLRIFVVVFVRNALIFVRVSHVAERPVKVQPLKDNKSLLFLSGTKTLCMEYSGDLSGCNTAQYKRAH